LSKDKTFVLGDQPHTLPNTRRSFEVLLITCVL